MDHSKIKHVYVICGKGERKFWHKIGVAVANRDGSLNCKLESPLINCELHIRDAVGRDSEEEQR